LAVRVPTARVLKFTQLKSSTQANFLIDVMLV